MSKQSIRSSLLFALLVCCVIPASGQKHYKDIKYPSLRAFEVPEAMRVEMSNGIILFLIEDHELPLISISARIGTGSVYEPADKVGLAAVTGDVMRAGGTTTVPGELLNERLEDIAASISTSIGETSGTASMSSLKENVDVVLRLFADVLMNPAFPEERIELSKSQASSIIGRRNDDSQDIAFREFEELLYGSDSPWARSTEYRTIDAITRDDVVAFHKQYFRPNNVIMGVWGDFDTVNMVKRLDKAFESWQKDEAFEKPKPPEIKPSGGKGVFLVPKNDVTQSTVLMGHVGEVRRDHADYPAITIMNEVLSGVSGRLYQHVRDDQGLAYAVFGGYTANYDRPGNFYTGVMTKSESTTEAAKSILVELRALQDQPPTAEEVNRAKEAFLNSFVFNFDTRSEVVGRMMTYETYNYPDDFLQSEKSAIEKVEPKDVQRVAQKYIRADESKFIVVGKPADFGEPLDALGAVTEIDITIPPPPPPKTDPADDGGEPTDGELEDGRALLGAAVEALGGAAAFDSVRTIARTATQEASTADNMSMKLSVRAIEEYGGRSKFVQTAPMGEISILIDGESIRLRSPEGEMDAPASVVNDVQSQRWRDIPFLFAHADEVTVQSLGAADFAGASVQALRISPPHGDAFTLFVSTDDNTPTGISYQATGMTGTTVSATDNFGEFATFAGLKLPMLIRTEMDGTSIVTRYESILINEPVDDSDFR